LAFGASASAAPIFTTINAPGSGELSHSEILGSAYSGTWNPTGMHSFTNGSLTATRVADDGVGGPLKLMFSGPNDADDQLWSDGLTTLEVEAKFADAKTPEEFEAAVSELKVQNEALERQILLSNVAAKYELPAALAKRLAGTTPEELEADAKELRKLVAPAAPESLRGGLDPEDDPDDFDPVKAVQAARRNRY
jgi:hypothetical protein